MVRQPWVGEQAWKASSNGWWSSTRASRTLSFSCGPKACLLLSSVCVEGVTERNIQHVNRRRSPPSLRPVLRCIESSAQLRCRADDGGLVAHLGRVGHAPCRWHTGGLGAGTYVVGAVGI